MRKFLLTLGLALTLSACGNTLLDKTASAQITNTAVLHAVELGVTTGKLTKADAQNLVKQVDLAQEGINLAPTLGEAGPDKLAQSRAILVAVQNYLLTKGVK